MHLYVQAPSAEGPFTVRSHLTSSSFLAPFLLRYDLIGPGLDAFRAAWSGVWEFGPIDRLTFARFEDEMARDMVFLRARAFS
jgi:hypothetical protein